jgi:hypothetical protein
MDTKTSTSTAPVNCACVIHGNGYNWDYVDRLYNMLSRNLSQPIQFHVYTEAARSVPAHMIKHELQEWPGVSGPKKSWWYKMQLFDQNLFQGQMLYLDLDVVIVKNIDWITKLSEKSFWAVHDFRRLWKPNSRTINSSVMYFNTQTHGYVWDKFTKIPLTSVMSRYRGDQDFITDAVESNHLRYFNLDSAISWRWQAIDNQKNSTIFTRKPYNEYLSAQSTVPESTSMLIFHGTPKPHEVSDPVVQQHWC